MKGLVGRKVSAEESEAQQGIEFFERVFNEARIEPFAVRLWDGSEWWSDDRPPRFTLKMKHPAALRNMFWRPSELSLGESFIYDDFDIEGDLEASFELADYLLERDCRPLEKLKLARKLLRLPKKSAGGNSRSAARLQGEAHSKERDADAVRYHYDVSNAFYKLWLDQRMIYSCALFHSPDDSLDEAQERKLDYICRKLRLSKGEKLLDIGCGWGGLIMHAARNYGVEALGITLSAPQAELANERIREAGLDERCRAEVCDYRDVPADRQFDKAVSVGMFEHVGETRLPDYFDKAYHLLKPGGVFLNHGITEAMTGSESGGPSFIDKYVFPDGDLLPISTSLRAAEQSGFEVRDVESLREHYAMTLRHWVDRLEANRERAIELTDPVTYRVWRIYMAGSAYGFKTGRIGIYQSLLAKSGRRPSGLPLTRCDWYRPCPGRYH